jgi:uncharacterized protein (AIM24 family)
MEGATVEDRLAGTIAPVLSISLDPGESIVAEVGEFSWMTDSIQMSAGPVSADQIPAGQVPLDQSRGSADEPAGARDRGGAAPLMLSTFTAKGTTGTISFAGKLPGSILGVDVSARTEYLVHQHGFVAGTPDIQIWPGFRQSFAAGIYAAEGFGLQRVAGEGRAWIEFAGEVVTLELAAGESLRAHPGHIGMFDASVAFQLMRVPGIPNRSFGPDAHQFAVLSGPGPVWLQSMLSPAPAASARDMYSPLVTVKDRT